MDAFFHSQKADRCVHPTCNVSAYGRRKRNGKAAWEVTV